VRIVVLVLGVALVAALVVAYYPAPVTPPATGGSGPLDVRMAPGIVAPEYHSPLPWWETHHMDVLNRGDLTEADCLYCHTPENSCNNCHSYVGARLISN